MSELSEAVASAKRHLGEETAPANMIAPLLPEHLREQFWHDLVAEYLGTRLAIADFASTPSLVEAAAWALHAHDRLELLNEPDWNGINEDDRESYRRAGRSVLGAVAESVMAKRADVEDNPPTTVDSAELRS